MVIAENFQEVIVESDFKVLIEAIKRGPTSLLREVEPIQRDICFYSRKIPSIKFQFVNRQVNQLVHLSTQARKNNLSPDWVVYPSEQLKRLVQKEAREGIG